MASYKIALLYAPNNEHWKTLYERIRNSFDEAIVELMAHQETMPAARRIQVAGAEVVLLDPDLVHLRQAIAEVIAEKHIIVLNLQELGVFEVNMPTYQPHVPIANIRSTVFSEYRALGLAEPEPADLDDGFALDIPDAEEELEPTRGIPGPEPESDMIEFGDSGEEEMLSRSGDTGDSVGRSASDLDAQIDDLLTDDSAEDFVRDFEQKVGNGEPPPQAPPPPEQKQQESSPPAPPTQPESPPPGLGANRTEAGRGLGISAEEFLNPQFSAYYPTRVAANRPYALMAFAHIESMANAVRDIAAGYQQMMGGQQSSGTASSKVEVSQGTPLTFVPRVDGLTFTPAEQVITWDGQPHYSATFLFQTPVTLKGDLTGRVLVFNGPLILGEIPVTMQHVLAAPGTSLDKTANLKKFDPIFASYSHRDTPVMEYFKRARENIGQKMLVDVYDLRAGEHWAQRLLDMIDESAVFQLFWSENSAQSDYCRQEWEHALRFLPERERFIQPVWWEDPMPSPPPELQDLHFQKINLPTGTRWKIRLGNLFG